MALPDDKAVGVGLERVGRVVTCPVLTFVRGRSRSRAPSRCALRAQVDLVVAPISAKES